MLQVAIMASEPGRRTWLERMLRGDPSLNVTGLGSTFAFLRSLLNDTMVHVAVIDLGRNDESDIGRDWLSELLNTVALVILSATDDMWLFNQVVHAERGAILNRDTSPERIVQAVQAVSVGLLVFDESLVPHPDAEDKLAEELTPREVQVLRLLAEGLVNRQIAERLNISEHTIKFHIGSILAKLQASSRTEAVTRGLRAGLIEL
jgi:two-component system, NarL family, response regulator YdfI